MTPSSTRYSCPAVPHSHVSPLLFSPLLSPTPVPHFSRAKVSRPFVNFPPQYFPLSVPLERSTSVALCAIPGLQLNVERRFSTSRRQWSTCQQEDLWFFHSPLRSSLSFKSPAPCVLLFFSSSKSGNRPPSPSYPSPSWV